MSSVSAYAFYSSSPAEQLQGLEQLVRVALAQWPGDYERVTPVKYRENAVFSTYDQNGQRYAVRIHRHGYHSDDALKSELLWMSKLSACGVTVPPVVPTRTGAMLALVQCPHVPEPRRIDLLEWLSGEPIGTSEEGLACREDEATALYYRVGKLAAQIHYQVDAWEPPHDFVRHAWDSDGLVGDEPFWGQFWKLPALTDDQRRLMAQARAQAARDLAAFGTSFDRYGLIHADFVPENLLDDGNDLRIIDFDDSGFGWHMFELATALFFNLDHPDYEQLKRAMFEGYRSVRSLPSDHEAMLPLFLFLRGTTYMGWLQTRPETQTAQEIGPMIVARVCELATAYLEG